MKLHLIKTSDGTLYQVIDQIPEYKQIDVEYIKWKNDCTHVFRKDGLLWFVRFIEEAQIIEEELGEVTEDSYITT